MRIIPLDISNKIHSRIQTLANECNPVLDARICRPETPLVNEVYLERQTVLNGVNATDVSVAVTHPSFGYNYANTKIFLAYISGGVLRVQTAAGKVRMQNHVWTDMGIEIPASACSIVLDGTMPKNHKGEVEFITDTDPWLFWVADTVLYGQKIGTDEPVILAETNCTDVSAVRAMWSSVGGFDFGLVVFFIIEGKLYYRQLINGEWMDAEVVSYGPSDVAWAEVATFRTWDYRIGVQAKTTTGAVYELYTQFMGVGKQLTEHLKVDVIPNASNIPIKHINTQNNEHIDTEVSVYGKRIYGLSSIPISAINVDDGTGNYGLIIHVTLDYPVTNVYGNNDRFLLKDGNGNSYSCTDASVSDDGLTLLLTFVDFNLAYGTDVTVEYTPGTILSPATAMDAFAFTFTPENLEPPYIPVPEPIEAWNLNAEGTEIGIRFSQPLIGSISGNETKISVTGNTYNYIPDGELEDTSRTVIEVSADQEDNAVIYLKFADGNINSIQNMIGDVSIAYSGGTLAGIGGPVDSFEISFTPNNLNAKNNPNEPEHIEVDVDINATLTRIHYTDSSETEHIEAIVTPIGSLISVEDI